jgi:hypothetical protein
VVQGDRLPPVFHLCQRGSGGHTHQVVAGERGGALLRCAEPGRTELLPVNVREVVDVKAVVEAFPVGRADELEAFGEDPKPLLDLRHTLVTLAIPDGEVKCVEGAAERDEDGGLERGGHAVGDGTDWVGVREAGVGRGGGFRQREDNEGELGA